MTETRNQLLTQLDLVARGDTEAAEAVQILRRAFDSDFKLADRIYACVRDLTWRALRQRLNSDEISQWFNVVKYAANLADKHELPEVKIRLRALGDLWSQSARFEILQPVSELLERKHVKELLVFLASSQSLVARTDLATQLKLATANLSRLVGLLASRGLIERSKLGKEAYFVLSAAGRTLLAEKDLLPAADNTYSDKIELDFDELPVMTIAWQRDGQCVHADPKLLDLLELDTDSPTWSAWSQCVAPMLQNEILQNSGETYELRVDRAVLHYEQRRLSKGGTLVMAFDVSALTERIALLEKLEVEAKDALADSEARLASHRALSSNLRTDLIKTSSDGVDRLRSIRDGILKSRPKDASKIEAVERYLSAIHYAATHFTDTGATYTSAPQYEEGSSLRQIDETVRAFEVLSSETVYRTTAEGFEDASITPAIRSVLGQVLMLCPKPVSLNTYEIENNLVLNFAYDLQARTNMIGNYGVYRYVMDSNSVWGQCLVVAKSFGCDFQLKTEGENSSFAVLFPLKRDRYRAVGKSISLG